MKANEVPEKIYLNPALDALTKALSEKTEDDIEYTRTDAFIEKACKWITQYILNHDQLDIFEMENDFRKAMEE